jgi:hypothetical protein
MGDVKRQPEVLEADGDRMPVTPELADVLIEVRSSGVVSFEVLLKSILSDPGPRVKAWLAKHGGRPARRGGDQRGWRSPLDRLTAMARLWVVRQAAAMACSHDVCYFGVAGPRSASTSSLLLDLARAAAAYVNKTEASDRSQDPLRGLELDEEEHSVAEAVLVNSFYPLEDHPLGGLAVRVLAQMSDPVGYPRGCGPVLVTVENLLAKGILVHDDEVPLTLDTRIRFSASVLREIVDELKTAATSESEWYAWNLEIRSGKDSGPMS